MSKKSIKTIAIRDGTKRYSNEHSDALFLTSSFIFNTAEDAKRVFLEETDGYAYSRFSNPTIKSLEDRMTSLEEGNSSVATATGMAAISSSIMSFVKAGDHIVSSNSIFGSTFALFNNYLTKMGVSISFVNPTNLSEWEEAIRPETKVLFLETPTNPLLSISDIEEIAKIKKKNNYGIRLVVDNTFATPILQRPLSLGADIVVHSATKHIDGQGRCLGGVVVCKNKKDRTSIHQLSRTMGFSIGAFDAWNLLKGLETLPCRIEKELKNTEVLAFFLRDHKNVEKVNYPGFFDHPGHNIAKKQMDGFSTVLSFTIRGSQKEAFAVIDNVDILSITANLGDTRSTITHPSTTTHGRLTEEERISSGITQNLIRVSVGLEDINDICDDLNKSLNKLT